MVRIDPDKVTPIKDEDARKAYLSKPAPRGHVRGGRVSRTVDNTWRVPSAGQTAQTAWPGQP
jgi:hypothetical protein